MRDYALASCGHCGRGVLERAAGRCPFQPHQLCATCDESVTTLIATLRAQGYDPFAKRRRGRSGRQPGTPQRPFVLI